MSTLHTGDEITRANLIVEIVQSLLGQGGVIFLGVVVSFACLTTSVGLASSCGSFFEELTIRLSLSSSISSYRIGIICK